MRQDFFLWSRIYFLILSRVQVIDGDIPKIKKEKEAILKAFHEGMDLFAQGQFQEALSKFRLCLDVRPSDKPSSLYVQRCTELLSSNYDLRNWDGVYHLADK